MKFFQDDVDMGSLEDCSSREYLDFISKYLETEEVETSYEIFKNDPNYNEEEMWTLPLHFKPWLWSDEVILKRENDCDLSLGLLTLGYYGDKKVVIEQNASPIQVYWSK